MTRNGTSRHYARARCRDRLATGVRRPDHTLLFDLPAEAARARGHSPGRRDRGEADRLDAEDVAFYDRVRRGFLEMAERDPRFEILDSSGPVAATEERMRCILGRLFGEDLSEKGNH